VCVCVCRCVCVCASVYLVQIVNYVQMYCKAANNNYVHYQCMDYKKYICVHYF